MKTLNSRLIIDWSPVQVGQGPPNPDNAAHHERRCRFWRLPSPIQIGGVERHGASIRDQIGSGCRLYQHRQQALHSLLVAPQVVANHGAKYFELIGIREADQTLLEGRQRLQVLPCGAIRAAKAEPGSAQRITRQPQCDGPLIEGDRLCLSPQVICRPATS